MCSNVQRSAIRAVAMSHRWIPGWDPLHSVHRTCGLPHENVPSWQHWRRTVPHCSRRETRWNRRAGAMLGPSCRVAQAAILGKYPEHVYGSQGLPPAVIPHTAVRESKIRATAPGFLCILRMPALVQNLQFLAIIDVKMPMTFLRRFFREDDGV